MPEIRAVVFDTNVFGSEVEPRMKVIERWANACAQHDAELWIPEVVCWELAERVVTRTHEVRAQLATYNSHRKKWGQVALEAPPLIGPSEVVDWIRDSGARVIPTSVEAALAGLRDQVLQEGPGSRKAQVKTGAADSAWLRSIAEANGGSFDGLVLVSGDASAVESIVEALGIDPPTMHRNLGELETHLGEASPATPDHLASVKAALTDLLDEKSDWRLDALIDAARSIISDHLPSHDDWSWEEQDSSMSLELGSVEDSGDFNPWVGSVSGRAKINIASEASFARQDQRGDDLELCQTNVEGYAVVEFVAFVNAAGPADVEELVVNKIEITYEETLPSS